MLVLAAAAAAMPAVAWGTNWTDGSGNWNTPGNWSAGVPGSGTAANIVESDGLNRVINYDYNGGAITIGVLTVNLAGGGGGTATTAISMAANNLTNPGEIIGGVVGGPGGGTGAFLQSGGVHTDTNALNLGFNANDNGFYSLSGSGTLADADYELLGVNGTGTFVQSAGVNSLNTNGQLVLGDDLNSWGAYTLSGTGSLYVNNSEIIGNLGNGLFTQLGGNHTLAAAANLNIGSSSGATGTYVLSGGTLTAKLQNIGVSGTGFFNQSGGLNTYSSNMVMELGLNAHAQGTYTLTGGTLAGENEFAGYAGTGTFSQSGGTNLIQDANQLIVGYMANSVGTYDLTGGSLVCDGIEETYSGTGSFVQSGGTNTMIDNSGLVLAALSGYGSYTLSGGVLTTPNNEIIGASSLGGGVAVGVFVQTGGTNNLPGASAMVMGYNPGGAGTYSLSGGTVNVGGGVYVGSDGTGVLNISGTGMMNSAMVVDVAAFPGSVLNLSGGTLNAGAIELDGGQSGLNWTGGTLNITANTTFDSVDTPAVTGGIFGSSLYLGNSMTLMITGNETLGGTGPFSLEIGAGSAHYVTGSLTVSPEGTLTQDADSSLYAATITQAGGDINGQLQNQGTFIYQSGQFNAELINQGNVTLGPVFTAGGGIENDATMSLSAGENIILNGIGLDNLGNFALNGATLNGSGTITNDYGGVFTARGTINPELINFGTLTVNGVLRLNNVAVNFGVAQGGGSVLGTFANAAGGVIDANGASPLVFNALTGNSATVQVAAGSTLNITDAWQNSGLVTMLGTGSLLGGASIANTGTIQGAGSISSPIDNQTGVIRPVGGELDLAAVGDTNDAGAQIQAPAGGTVLFIQGLPANDGIIALTGGAFDNNNLPIVNDATGSIIGSGTFRSGGLTNNGTFNLSGTSSIFGPVINNDASVLHISGTGTDSFFGAVTNGGTVQIDPGASAIFYGPYNGTGPVSNDGLISLQANSTSANISGLGVLAIGSPTTQAKVQLAFGSGTSQQTGLTIYGGSLLDITNNTLEINYVGSPDPVATIVSLLATGYGPGKNWQGTAGILSSTAGNGPLSPLLSVGYADGDNANDLSKVTGLLPNQLLIKYTLAGDANLDGQVNFADLLIVAQDFNKTGEDWVGGNFIYNPTGLVNFNDLLIVAQNFNKILTPANTSLPGDGGNIISLAIKVPEPSALALIASVGAGLLPRRRRRVC
jgi:hypothetical protein